MFFVLAMFGYIAPMAAQEGLNISDIMNGRYSKTDRNVKEVFIQGKKLKQYNLSLFHSLIVNDKKSDADIILSAVEADTGNAIEKEEGKIGGKLYYGFYVLPKQNGKYRYVFYRDESVKNPDNNEVSLVYMEGNTSLEELKKMFR
jgi:hypothetical protein